MLDLLLPLRCKKWWKIKSNRDSAMVVLDVVSQRHIIRNAIRKGRNIDHADARKGFTGTKSKSVFLRFGCPCNCKRQVGAHCGTAFSFHSHWANAWEGAQSRVEP